MGDAVPVELRQTGDGWQLVRGGEPYFIRGAGGEGSLAALAAAGANSVRTWGGDPGALLDEAQALGMTVTVGIWLGHERHGFDYSDPDAVAAQLDRAREVVLRYRSHPALLLWGVGNEMEGFDEGDDPRIWAAVDDVAAMVKELDRDHPTMTVTTFVHGQRIEYVHRRSPAIDIHGINAYGGAKVVPDLLRAGGATKPFILTEFGPAGPWERPKTDWGAPIEQTSTEKAAAYRETYEAAVLGSRGMSLGSYAFLWGHKMEATPTWFGMFLDDGSPTAAVGTMTELWTGSPPANRAPTVEPIVLDGPAALGPGATLRARSRATDPEGGRIRAAWELRPESGEYLTGGDFRQSPPPIDGAIIDAGPDGARIRVPEAPGPYRIYFYARDDVGNAATANVPILVKGEVRTPMPFPVYEDGFEGMPWVPSGWMGDIGQLSLDGDYEAADSGSDRIVRIRFEGRFGWAGIAWQDPPNNWGDQDGGYDLTGASALTLRARGRYGGETVNFGVGLLEGDRAHPDSAITKTKDIVLTSEWRDYRVPLNGLDLSSIKTGFVVTLTGRATPVTIYLDDIRFVP